MKHDTRGGVCPCGPMAKAARESLHQSDGERTYDLWGFSPVWLQTKVIQKQNGWVKVLLYDDSFSRPLSLSR
jgi:hypothetical protein